MPVVKLTDPERLLALEVLYRECDRRTSLVLKGRYSRKKTVAAADIWSVTAKFLPKPRTHRGVRLYASFNRKHKRIDWVSIPASER